MLPLPFSLRSQLNVLIPIVYLVISTFLVVLPVYQRPWEVWTFFITERKSSRRRLIWSSPICFRKVVGADLFSHRFVSTWLPDQICASTNIQSQPFVLADYVYAEIVQSADDF